MKNLVFMFDGQGAFKPGVGKDLNNRYPKANKIIKKSSEKLGYDLIDFLWGAKASETSNRTSIAQPAISAISLAYAEVLKDLGIEAEVCLGHSLGELTAIVYCGIVKFEDGIKIIQKRGELMEKGGKQGSMMAVLNIELNGLKSACQEIEKQISEPVVIANINAPDQIVVSGSKEGLKMVAQYTLQNHGRSILLSVGGAWHSPYLNDVAKDFAQFLDGVKFRKPSKKFYSVVEQKTLDDADLIKDSLKRQMLAQVNWVSAIENLHNLGYERFLEIGPSKILKDLVIKVKPGAKTESTALFTDLTALKKSF